MYPESPRDLIRRGAESHGDRLAVITPDERLTYRQFADRTTALAQFLQRAGVGAGIQVALTLPNSIAYLVWYFGVLEAGGIVVPLAPGVTSSEAAELLDSAGIHFLAVPSDSSLSSELEMPRSVVSGALEGVNFCRASQGYPVLETAPWTPDGFMVRQFSSGSTGRPKHMLKTEANIAHNTRCFCEAHGLEGDESFLGVAPFHHAYGNLTYHAAFYLGGSVTVVPRFLTGTVLSAARRDRPTVFLATPQMIELLGSCFMGDGDAEVFQNLKHCVCDTGPLNKVARDAFYARFGIPVRPRYGTTETLSTTVDLDGFEEGRVGRPYPGVEIGIFDNDFNLLPAETRGRIGIWSPAACSGYVNDPENTARTFRGGYAFPGDAGYLDRTGRLYVLGRSDIIDIGGYKVDGLEVEKVIRECLPVKDVIVLEGERSGIPVVRAVVEADPAKVTRAMVIDACRMRLSRHKVPAVVEVRERLPRDANGKVLRASLDA